MKKNGAVSTGQEFAGKVGRVNLAQNTIRFHSECRLASGDVICVDGLEGEHPIESLFLERHENVREIKRARIGVTVHAKISQTAVRRIAKLPGMPSIHRLLGPLGG